MARGKYFTKEKKESINHDNMSLYEKYLKSNIIKNKEVEETTYKVYKNYFTQFLVYLSEEWNNIDLYDDEIVENGVDVMEGFIAFCQDKLGNNKKVINTKLSAVSSFYLWSIKRGYIDVHPFDKKLDRMKGANEEKIVNSYFLTNEEVQKVTDELASNKKYDLQDRILWHIALDSCNRVGALSNLQLSKLDLDNCLFSEIREKRGYKVEVVFSEETRDLIEIWLDERKKNMDNLEVDSLFISWYDGKYRAMSKTSLQLRVYKIGEILGLKDFHIHTIRKTALNLLNEKTNDISLVAEFANHKSIETTRSHYLKPKSKTEIRDKIKELAKKKNEKQE